MTETELQEIEKRCKGMNPGTWAVGAYLRQAYETDIPALLSTVRELQRQVQEGEADARRYRWLRDGYDGTASKAGRPVIVCNVAGEIPELNAAIDKAMSGRKPHER